MTQPDRPTDGITPGHYAAKQVLSSSRAIRWTHGGRFRAAIDLVGRYGGDRLLDYGCGDGTFLQMLLDLPRRPATLVGAEISDDLIEDCRSRFASVADVSFVRTDALPVAGPGSYDTVVCMEVLEHVVDVRPVLDHFERLLAPGGHVIISVPVETGVPVLIKQSARRLAGWRGIGDYPGVTPYSLRELAASFLATSQSQLARPVFTDAHGCRSHDHKGFNWMFVRDEVARRFRVVETAGSPVRWLPPHFNSQAWIVASRR